MLSLSIKQASGPILKRPDVSGALPYEQLLRDQSNLPTYQPGFMALCWMESHVEGKSLMAKWLEQESQ